MARRKVGWGDDSVGTTDWKKNRERQFRGKRGEKRFIRVMGDPEVFRDHKVDDVRPEKDGEPQAFNMQCAKTWDEEEEEWTGDCLGCDKDYEVKDKFIVAILFLATKIGKKKPKPKDPDEAVFYWDFGNDKYQRLSEIVDDLSGKKKPKKLHQVELQVSCTTERDEKFQDLTIEISGQDPFMKEDVKGYMAAFKEEAGNLVDEAAKEPTIAEQKRRLKPIKSKKKDDDDLDLEDEDDDEDEDEAPKRKKKSKKKAKGSAKKKSKKKGKKKKPEPEEDEDDEEDEEELEDLLAELEDDDDD